MRRCDIFVIVWVEDLILLTKRIEEERWNLVKSYGNGRDSRRVTARRAVKTVCGVKPDNSRAVLIKEIGAGQEIISVFEVRLQPDEAETFKDRQPHRNWEARLFPPAQVIALLGQEDQTIVRCVGL